MEIRIAILVLLTTFSAMSKGERKRPTEAQKRELAAFFESSNCIVDGTDGPEFHHLDEDPANTIFENLVPINGTLNCQIETNVEAIETGRIQSIAQTLESRGRYTRAYGCNRLLGWIYKKRCESDLELISISICIRNLRPILNYRLLEHLFKTSLNQFLADRRRYSVVSCNTLAMICEELSNLLREGGLYSEFDRWNRFKDEFLKMTSFSRDSVFRRIQSLRHDAFSLSEQGNWKAAIDTTERAIALGKDTGFESLIIDRKSHTLFELRKHRELRKVDEFFLAIEHADKVGNMIRSPTDLAAILNTRMDPQPIDRWAECHMQNLRVALLHEQGNRRKASELFATYADQYKRPYGIKATASGNIAVLSDYLRSHAISAIWKPIPLSLQQAIIDLRLNIPAIISEQARIGKRWYNINQAY